MLLLKSILSERPREEGAMVDPRRDMSEKALNDLRGIHERVSDILGWLLGKPSTYLPDYDIYMLPEYILLVVNLAGVDPTTLKVEVLNPRVVSISGVKKLKVPEALGLSVGLEDSLLVSNYWGRFNVDIDLPEEVETSSAEAVFSSGLLFVKLRRLAKKVDIS